MPDLNTITEALENADYFVDHKAQPGHGAVEYVRESRSGEQEVVIVDFRNSTVTKERYNTNGKQTAAQTVDVAVPGNMNLALRLTA